MKNLLLIVLLMMSCQPPSPELTTENLSGTWLGGSYTLDDDAEFPISQFMEINDSSQIRYITGSWRDTFQDFRIEVDSIHFPYRSYKSREVRFNSEKLRLGNLYSNEFKRVEAEIIDIDTVLIKEILMIDQWTTEKHILEFKGDSLIQYDIRSGIKNRFCWEVYDFYGYKFFQKKGSFLNCERPYYGLGLIHRISEDSLVIENWMEGSFETLTYKRKKINVSHYKEPTFKMCNPRLYENRRSDWYFFKYPSFEGGLYSLKKFYDLSYDIPKSGKIDGLVKVQFVINCEGKIGRLESMAMDSDYKKIKLNPRVEGQIMDLLPKAGSWIPAEFKDQQVDAFKYLIFRVKDGKIDEIYP